MIVIPDLRDRSEPGSASILPNSCPQKRPHSPRWQQNSRPSKRRRKDEGTPPNTQDSSMQQMGTEYTQAEFQQISQEQLAAEVKGIYAGLVMVESKCINIDFQKAGRISEKLTTEQWRALIALHRTLLYEHHDFMMATQHPSANSVLLELANKYSMPARMWKHGTHAFLELLRHHQDSQEHLLVFIDLAYRHISTLLKTVPTFTETWIQCQGDVTRYLMAFEATRGVPRGPLTNSAQCAGSLSSSIQTWSKLSHIITEPIIHGRLMYHEISAFPDTGAAANFISLGFVKRHGCVVNANSERFVRLGGGSMVRTLGTTELPFSFAGETEGYNLVFNVLRTCVHEVILGGQFLRDTQTLTRYRHRMKRKPRQILSHDMHKICLLGCQLLVRGLVNGAYTNAIPDTGADVSLMSASFAAANGFAVNSEKSNRVTFSFANGSTVEALGVVKEINWRYGIDNRAHLTDFYVLADLPVDVVLGFDFLCQTDAFSEYEDEFWNLQSRGQEDALMLSLIRILTAVKPSKAGHTPSDTGTPNISEESLQSEKTKALDEYRTARNEARTRNLSGDETTQYLEPYVARWKQACGTSSIPGASGIAISPAPSSDSASASSLQTGGAQMQHPVTPTHTSKSSNKLVRWFKRKSDSDMNRSSSGVV